MKKILFFMSLILGNLLFANERPLIIGIELAYPPVDEILAENIDKNGRPTGINVDIAYALGKYLERDIIIEDLVDDDLNSALASGRMDIVLSPISNNNDVIEFSKPYTKSNLGVLVNKNTDIKNLIDLNKNDKRIIVKSETNGYKLAEKYFPNAEIITLTKERKCIIEIAEGRADAFIYDPLVMPKNWIQEDKNSVIKFDKIEDESQPWGIAYRKVDQDLGKKIDEFIILNNENGEFDRLIDKYFEENKVKISLN